MNELVSESTTAALFLNLSTVLTGFQPVDLQGTGLVQAYCHKVSTIIGQEITNELLTLADSILKQPGGDEPSLEKIEQAIRQDILASPKLGPVARNIIKLWYLGTWYPMSADWRKQYGVSSEDREHIISAAAYEESLVWRAMGSHPPGAKQPGFGTWSLPPR